jgi:hypothetical protein
MASSLAIFAAARGMQAGQGIGDAYKQKVFAKLQADAVKNQISEIDKRASIEIGQIFAQGERVAAEQTAAYIKGGVEIEGSAMDTISDTMSDAAEAAYIRRREADYEIVGLEMQKASLKEASSDMNFFLNSLSAVGGAYAGYQMDKYQYNRSSLRNKGTSSKPSGQYAYNYSGNDAMGLA